MGGLTCFYTGMTSFYVVSTSTSPELSAEERALSGKLETKGGGGGG